jgi:hypothetical protein
LYIVIFSISTYILYTYYNTRTTPPAIRKTFSCFFTLFEYSSFAYFIFLHIQKRFFKNLIIVFSLLFFLFVIVYYFFASLQKAASVPLGIQSIFILIFSAYFLYEQVNDPTNLFIYNDFRFWIVLGFMIYLSGSFFIYLLANQIPEKELAQYWMFTDIFYTLKNILFVIGILVYALQPKKKHHIKSKANHHYLDIT